jgi:Na+-driven multidrug efflux pump
MWTLLIGVLLNCVLAPVFLFVFHWGMRGAALATAISQGVSMVWVLAYFLRGRSTLRFHWRLLRLHGGTCGRILLYGLPMFVMMMFAALMLSIVNSQASFYGNQLPLPNGGAMALAVWGSIYTLFMVSNMPIYGINQGTQPVVGFNYGAKRFDRVKQALVTGISFASLLTIFGFVVAMALPGPVLGLFINAESADRPQLIAIGIHAMRISFLMSPLLGFQAVSAGYFQAVGKPREATFLMLSRQVFLLIPLVYFLPKYFGLDGVWMALPVSDCVSSLVTGVCLFFELRRLDVRHQAEEEKNLNTKAAKSAKETGNISEPCV